MKKLFNFSMVLMLTGLSVMAQPPGGGPHCKQKQEQLKAQKVAFITSELSLTPEQAQVFWPVYNQFDDKREALRDQHHQIMRKCGMRQNDCSEKEIEEVVDEMVAFRLKEAELTNEYHVKFKEILPVEKVFELYKAERNFKRYLLKQIKEHNGPPPMDD